jgi:hypothetical protein
MPSEEPVESVAPSTGVPRRGDRGLVLLLGAWLAFVSLPPVGLAMVRERLLSWQSSPAAQAEWDRFREAVREGKGTGPVLRKVPKSAEPPLKVWLRDYFPLAVAAWVLFGSIVFLVTGMLARGALRAQPATPTAKRA